MKANPDTQRDWQQRSRQPLARNTPLSRGGRMRSRGGKPEVGSVRDLERTLDDLVRQVLHQTESVCFTDGRPGTADDPLEVSHLFGRSKRPTRFDCHPDGNNHLMHRSCNGCHNSNRSIYLNVFIERCGQDAYEEIAIRAHQGGVFDYLTLHSMILQRQSMLK